MQFDRLNSKAPLAISYLFVPGNRPERFSKAVEAGPDAIILDLEDAVHPDSKTGRPRRHLGLAGDNAKRCLRASTFASTASAARCFART